MFETKLARASTGTVAAMVLLVALVGGDLAWSYMQGVRGMVQESLRDATSIQFDLKRLDQAIDALTPTLRENRKTAAELDVEIEFLESDTGKMEDKQRLAKAEMQELRDALEGNATTIDIDGRAYDRATVESDLLRRLESYEMTQKQLATRRELLRKRRQTLSHAVSSIRDNEHEQRVLADLADSLNAELKLLGVASATSNMNFRNPQLAQTQELAAEIRKRILTLQQMCDHEQPGRGVQVNLDRRTAAECFDQTFAKK